LSLLGAFVGQQDIISNDSGGGGSVKVEELHLLRGSIIKFGEVSTIKIIGFDVLI
jgi:hypothetical protein